MAPGVPLCNRSNKTPAGNCLQCIHVLHVYMITGTVVQQAIAHMAYQRSGSPSSSNQGVFTASFTSGGNTCCTFHPFGESVVGTGQTAKQAYPKMVKGLGDEAWQVGTARKQNLNVRIHTCARVENFSASHLKTNRRTHMQGGRRSLDCRDLARAQGESYWNLHKHRKFLQAHVLISSSPCIRTAALQTSCLTA